MELTREIWEKALKIDKYYTETEHKHVSRPILVKELGITKQLARSVNWALHNKQILSLQPLKLDYTDRHVLVLADVHLPYEDKLAVQAMFDYVKDKPITDIVILGDLIDFYQVSSFSKDPRRSSLATEFKAAKKFLQKLRNIFPEAEIIYKSGNHDGTRLERYIFNNAPELTDLLEGLLEKQLGLDELKIKYVEDPFKIGKLWYLHGHEIKSGGNPEYITNVVWKKVHDNFICGHWHRSQNKIFKNIEGKIYEGCVVGSLCELKVDYQPVNNWNHGFAIVHYDTDGGFKIDNKKIFDGVVY